MKFHFLAPKNLNQVGIYWLPLILAAGCSATPTLQRTDDAGVVVAAITGAPANIHSVAFDFDASRSVHRCVDISDPASSRIEGLPTGEVTVNARAFASADCSGSVAWHADSQTVRLAAGEPQIIRLVFHPNGILLIETDFVDDAHRASLSGGWDIFNAPLRSGVVLWNTLPNRHFNLDFTLQGAEPNHEYTVGAHFFQAGLNVDFGAGQHVGAVAPTTREGITTEADSWDFGYLTTDVSGNGLKHLELVPNPGTYHVQFTVRVGGAPGCPTTECEAVYRTGEKFSVNTELIVIR